MTSIVRIAMDTRVGRLVSNTLITVVSSSGAIFEETLVNNFCEVLIFEGMLVSHFCVVVIFQEMLVSQFCVVVIFEETIVNHFTVS